MAKEKYGILQFMGEHPILTFFLVWIIAWGLADIFIAIFGGKC